MDFTTKKVSLLRDPTNVFAKNKQETSMSAINGFLSGPFVNNNIERTFQFKERLKPLDIAKFNNVDIDNIIETKNIRELLTMLEELTFSSMDKRQLRGISDECLVKLFHLSQLLMEYLLYTHQKLQEKIRSSKDQRKEYLSKIDKQEQQLNKNAEEIVSLKNKLKQYQSTIQTYETLLRSTPPMVPGKVYACTYPGCCKAFISEQYLISHWGNKHPDLPYTTSTSLESKSLPQEINNKNINKLLDYVQVLANQNNAIKEQLTQSNQTIEDLKKTNLNPLDRSTVPLDSLNQLAIKMEFLQQYIQNNQNNQNNTTNQHMIDMMTILMEKVASNRGMQTTYINKNETNSLRDSVESDNHIDFHDQDDQKIRYSLQNKHINENKQRDRFDQLKSKNETKYDDMSYNMNSSPRSVYSIIDNQLTLADEQISSPEMLESMSENSVSKHSQSPTYKETPYDDNSPSSSSKQNVNTPQYNIPPDMELRKSIESSKSPKSSKSSKEDKYPSDEPYNINFKIQIKNNRLDIKQIVSKNQKIYDIITQLVSEINKKTGFSYSPRDFILKRNNQILNPIHTVKKCGLKDKKSSFVLEYAEKSTEDPIPNIPDDSSDSSILSGLDSYINNFIYKEHLNDEKDFNCNTIRKEIKRNFTDQLKHETNYYFKDELSSISTKDLSDSDY